MLSFKGTRFPIDVILVCIRWYAAYPLSYRHLEQMMEERSVSVDHSTIKRWAIRFLPLLEKLSRRNTRKVGISWRMDETHMVIPPFLEHAKSWHSPIVTDTSVSRTVGFQTVPG